MDGAERWSRTVPDTIPGTLTRTATTTVRRLERISDTALGILIQIVLPPIRAALEATQGPANGLTIYTRNQPAQFIRVKTLTPTSAATAPITTVPMLRAAARATSIDSDATGRQRGLAVMRHHLRTFVWLPHFPPSGLVLPLEKYASRGVSVIIVYLFASFLLRVDA